MVHSWQHIMLKKWTPKFDFKREQFVTLPIWVKLYDIPTVYWTPFGISAMASKLGTLLYANEATSSTSYVDFARVCIEMKVGNEFANQFKVSDEFGEKFTIRVAYDWVPRICSKCNIFGHSTSQCSQS